MYRIILLTLILFIPYFGYTQIKPKETKKSYESNGKIYWNKSLPIKITLSSPDNNNVELKKPFYLDTEGINFIRTKWEMDSTSRYINPLREQIWEIYADSKPPITKSKFIANSSYVYKNRKYYSDDLKINLISKDELSGVAKIYYSINNSDYKIYVDFIRFEIGIDIRLKFYAVDNVGNIEDIEELKYEYDNNNLNFSIDNTPPETKIISEKEVLSPKNLLTLKSDDFDGVGVHSTYYNIDNDITGEIYTKPISISSLDEGYHKMKYFSQDWINNKEKIKEYSFYLDKTAPEIKIIEEIVDKSKNIRNLKINAIDNKSGVEKIMIESKNGEYVEYIEPLFIDITHQEIKIKAIDSVGNESIRIIKYNEIR